VRVFDLRVALFADRYSLFAKAKNCHGLAKSQKRKAKSD